MSKNEQKEIESVIPSAKKDLDLVDRIDSLEKRVNILESRLEKVDHYTAIQGQNMNVNSRNRRGRTGV